MEFTRLFSVSAMKFPREIEVVPELNLLFVGYVGGFVYIYQLDDPRFPICNIFIFTIINLPLICFKSDFDLLSF